LTYSQGGRARSALGYATNELTGNIWMTELGGGK